MASLGGILYAPSNYDGLAYRTPRILHWLAESRWHWIHTEFHRLNARACGFEWVSAPFLALAHTDRLLFLINLVSFALLPGLLFSIFCRLAISPRVARVWMWLLPTGYCYLLQAGSIGNDLFTTTLVLAAVDFALRARSQRSVGALWLSILSAALFTGAKAHTLPLGLAWLVVVFPALPLVFKNFPGTLLALIVSLTVSFLPTAVLNYRFGGDWTGAAAEHLELSSSNPSARLIGNTETALIGNFIPPILPFARAWNHKVAPALLPLKFRTALNVNLSGATDVFSVGELQTEESAGLGAGVCWLFVALLILLFKWLRKIARPPQTLWTSNRLLFVVATLIGACAFFTASLVQPSTPRLLAPYYPLLIVPLLLVPGHLIATRMAWFRFLVVLISLVAGILLVVNPARPLFPLRILTPALQKVHAPSALISRAERVYSVYSQRPNAFDAALAVTPSEARVLGIVTSDDPEAALWKPYGSRRIVHVCVTDEPGYIRSQGVQYIWVNRQVLEKFSRKRFEQWLAWLNGECLKTITLDLRAGKEPFEWSLVRLN